MNLRLLRRRLTLGLPLLPLVALGLSACGVAGGTTVSDTSSSKVIPYQGEVGLVNYVELADALGYFQGTGIKLKMVGEVGGGPAQLQGLATGVTDFASGPFQGATMQLQAHGVPIKAVVATYGSNAKAHESLVTLKNSSIRSAKDLIGKKVAVNTLGANAEADIDTWLTQQGLSPAQIKKVTLVPLPAINLESALRKGQVNASVLAFAGLLHAQKTGGIRTLFTDTRLLGPYNGGSLVLTDKFIKDDPTTSRQLVSAVAKAIHWDQHHKPAQTRRVYDKYLVAHGRKDETSIYDTWVGNGVGTPDGVLRPKDFSLWFKWLEQRGTIRPGQLKLSDVYTNKFNPYAKKG